MARLYIFAIGGTGSRVLKSLTMLLASGVKPNSVSDYEIVPIIIDPHKSNEDLKRTVSLLDNYQKIAEQTGSQEGFFSTRVSTLDKLVTSQNRLSGSFTFSLQEVANTRFKEYIDYNLLDEPNKSLTDLLFSGNSINKHGEPVDLLDVEMDIGFVGNPNIGSVVLNQVKDSEEFVEFASNYSDADRVFIISSIFGGTGAAGFPTLLKNIRDARNNSNINGVGFLQDAKIGAVTVLPYFNIESDSESPIQKSDFIAKTKSALSYYKDNVNSSVNALYYLADDFTGKPYKNDPGNNGQKNEAHFIEMAAALSIIDFLEISDSDLICQGGVPLKPIYKEFGIKNDKADLAFADFSDYTERQISLNLSQLILFKKFLNEQIMSSAEKEAWTEDEPKINKRFLDSPFYRTNLLEFLKCYEDWLTEMSNNRRGFSPFNPSANLDSFINGKKVKSGIFTSGFNYHNFNDKLSKLSKGVQYPSASAKIMNLFFKATEDLLKSKYGINN